MLKNISRFIQRMFHQSSSPELSHLDAESFILSYRAAKSPLELKRTTLNYLDHHLKSESLPKVKDFPLDADWINTNAPLSIYKELKGKLVLLDFFTYCCINCMHVLPDLKILENKFSIENGLVVIGVHCAKFKNEKLTGNIESAVRRYEISHPVINDCKGIMWDNYNINCWPSLVLIGPNSKVLLRLSGEGHLDLLSNFIEETLRYMEDKQCLSDHSIPQIQITNKMSNFGPLAYPGKIFYYDKSKMLAISDSGHHRILITDQNGTVLHIIGGTDAGFRDGNFVDAKFNSPQGIAFKNDEILYVADNENHAIREINLEKKFVRTVVGSGKQGSDHVGGKLWQTQEISSPWDICFSKNTNVLFIAMAGLHQIWALYLCDDGETFFKNGVEGQCKAIAGSGREENRNNHYAHAAGFAQPSGLAYCAERHSIFIADSESSSIRELNLTTGKVSGIVGGNRNPLDLFAFGDADGFDYDAQLQHPLGVTWDENDRKLYVADSYNHKIKVIELGHKNNCSTIKLNTKLNEPAGICTFQGDILIADTNNNSLKLYSTKELFVSLFPITIPQSCKPKNVNVEKSIKMNFGSNQLTLELQVNKPASVSYTENAPSSWTICFVDEYWNKESPDEIRIDFKPEIRTKVTIPNSKNKVKLLINGVIYYCKNSACAIEKISYVVNVELVNSAQENVSCAFSHTLS